MKIIEIYIENFGKLSQYRKSFNEGLNSLTEDNGFGKTTLSVFIKAMLYGFDESRKMSLDENERKKNLPWQGGSYGGWLSFSYNGKKYRVERTFSQKASEDTYALYDLETGLESQDFSDNLGQELFGIDADGFERTVFLSEKNISGKNTNQTISAKLSDLVGVEGDIGGFDEAIKLLDERRKFYQKKGGAGGIQDVKAEFNATEERLNILKQRKQTSIEYEKTLRDIDEKIKSIKDAKEVLLSKQRQLVLEKEQFNYEIRYNEMINELASDEEREAELNAFFAKKLPANHEIAAYSDCKSEIDRLEKSLSEIGENEELSRLDKIFKAGPSLEECEKMTVLATECASDNARLLGGGAKKATAPSMFKTIPDESQIESVSARLEGNKASGGGGAGIPLTVIGILIITIGIFLGFAISHLLYSIVIIGFLVTFVGIFSSIKRKKKSERGDAAHIRSFIKEVYGDEFEYESEFSALIQMRADLERYKTEQERLFAEKEELDSIRAKLSVKELKLREFMEKFPMISALTPEEKTAQILHMRQRYDLLLEDDRGRDGKRTSIKSRIEELNDAYQSFISNFDTKTENPLNEIRIKLAEYEVLKSSLLRRRTDAKNYASTHSIDTEKASFGFTRERIDDPNIELKLSQEDEKLLEAERQKAKLENDYSITVRDIEEIEELEAKLREYTEKIEIYTSNLSVITKTKDMLSKAKSNMTAKYLGSVRDGFEKYMKLIGENSDEFTMDTSFVITKSDMGKSRQADAYSRGTKDLHALALRLALIDSLYEKELPPIILDDPFISFDDKHVEKAISTTKKLAQNRQIIYFTCSKSRKI